MQVVKKGIKLIISVMGIVLFCACTRNVPVSVVPVETPTATAVPSSTVTNVPTEAVITPTKVLTPIPTNIPTADLTPLPTPTLKPTSSPTPSPVSKYTYKVLNKIMYVKNDPNIKSLNVWILQKDWMLLKKKL